MTAHDDYDPCGEHGIWKDEFCGACAYQAVVKRLCPFTGLDWLLDCHCLACTRKRATMQHEYATEHDDADDMRSAHGWRVTLDIAEPVEQIALTKLLAVAGTTLIECTDRANFTTEGHDDAAV
jgi:hypothetical protein